MKEVIVEENNIRLDTYLASHLDISRSKIKKLLDEKKILVNGKDEKASYKVEVDDIITINENKICFSSILSDKETIYIIILNIFDDRKIKIRYYYIPSFILYHFKILFE